MADSQRGAKSQVDYNHLISNKHEWNNCFIYNTKELQYLSSPAVLADASMAYEFMYYELKTNQNSGIAIYHG